MSALRPPLHVSSHPVSPGRLALLILAALTAGRIAALFALQLDLGPDEAQYWSWAQQPAGGYFSKPPLIAWLIALTTPFSDAPPFVRLSSPVIHFATGMTIYALARALYGPADGPRIALWSALIFATLPAVWFSSGLISTDVPLLLFWSLALYGLHQVLSTGRSRWAVLTGGAIGLGLLSKYAMVYFFAGAGLYFLLVPQARWLFTRRAGLRLTALILAVAGAVFSPNLVWNATHDFSTVAHTAANANWGADLFNIASLGRFLGSQFGVFGPFLFAGFLWILWRLAGRAFQGRGISHQTAFLLSFSLPILALVTVQSFISRANANWAATAYVAATVLTVAWWLKDRRRWLLHVSLALHLGTGLAMGVLAANPLLIEASGLSNAFKRVRGWHDLAAQIDTLTRDGGYPTLLTDDRLIMAELLYYARPRPYDILIWDQNRRPENHYELTAAFGDSTAEPVLLAARADIPVDILKSFDTARFLRLVIVRTGKDKARILHLYHLEGYHGR